MVNQLTGVNLLKSSKRLPLPSLKQAKSLSFSGLSAQHSITTARVSADQFQVRFGAKKPDIDHMYVVPDYSFSSYEKGPLNTAQKEFDGAKYNLDDKKDSQETAKSVTKFVSKPVGFLAGAGIKVMGETLGLLGVIDSKIVDKKTDEAFDSVDKGIQGWGVDVEEFLLGDKKPLKETYDKKLDTLNARKNTLSDAKSFKGRLEDILSRLVGKEDAHHLQTQDRRDINDGFNSNFSDVQATHKQVVYTGFDLPGFWQDGGERGNLGNAALISALDDVQPHQPEATRIKGLKKLHKLELDIKGALNESRVIYPKRHQDSEIGVKHQALLSMVVEQPGLRPANYDQLLQDALLHHNHGLKKIALTGLKEVHPASSPINIELERIADPHSDSPTELKAMAVEVLKLRKAKRVYVPMVPSEIAKNVSRVVVGNPELQDDLEDTLMRYKTKLSMPENKGSNVVLYLKGKPGIGKTLLIQTLAHHGFGPKSLVYVDMSQIKNVKQMKDQLEHHKPLAGKVVFFDEFHTIQNIEDERTRDALTDYLKPIFGREEYRTDVSFKDALVAVATNQHVKNIPVLKSDVAAPMVDRLVSHSKKINMEPDMKDHIDSIVEGFDSQHYYQKEFKDLSGGVTLDGPAKQFLKTKIAKDIKADEEEEVSGRDIVARIADKIITQASKQDMALPRQKPLHVSVAADGKNLTLS